MIDKLDRHAPRFPPQCEPRVAAEIDARLAALDAGPGDLAMTQGACGADLLFAEAVLRRGATLQLDLPFSEDLFLARSVDFKKASSCLPDRWRDRF
ncbi:MAG: tetratricopeptide repeat protein, partial [Burkholderiaceae bacterium]